MQFVVKEMLWFSRILRYVSCSVDM